MGSLKEWVVLQQPDCELRAFACCSVCISRLFFLCKQSMTVDTLKQTIHVKILLQDMFSTAGSGVSFLPLAPTLQSYAMYLELQCTTHQKSSSTAPMRLQRQA